MQRARIWPEGVFKGTQFTALKQPLFAALDASYCEIITFLRPNLVLVAILDANNSLAIYLPDIKFRRFIGMGKGYEHAKLQLDRLSNKRVMSL